MPRKTRSTLDPDYIATVLETSGEPAETEDESVAAGKRKKKRKESLPEDYLASFSDEPRKRRRRKRKRRRRAEGDDYLSVITEPPERKKEKPRRKKANTTTIPSDYLDLVMDPPPDEEVISPVPSPEEQGETDEADRGGGPSEDDVAAVSREGEPLPPSEESVDESEDESDDGEEPRAPRRGPDGRFLPRSGSERPEKRRKPGKGRSAAPPEAPRRDDRVDTKPLRRPAPASVSGREPLILVEDAGSFAESESSPAIPFGGTTMTFQTFHLPGELYERARNAIRHLSGTPHELTFARLTENAFRSEVERLENEHNGGKPFSGPEEKARETSVKPPATARPPKRKKRGKKAKRKRTRAKKR